MALLKKDRKRIRDYPCPYNEKYYMETNVFEESDIKFPDAYKTANGMISIAKTIAEENGLDILSLPFCHTVELESFGGLVNFGDGKVGPRPGDYVLTDPRDFLKLPEPDLNKGRISEVIKAVSILKEKGHTIVVNINGAVAIMSGMMELIPILKALRREKDYIIEALEMFRKFELKYYEALVDAGADIISMTELSMPKILGPEIVETIVKYFLYPFLKDAEKIGDNVIHLCPKSTYGLVDSGYGDFVEIKLSEIRNYGKAMLEAKGEYRIFGRRCIGTLKTKITNKKLRAVKLK